MKTGSSNVTAIKPRPRCAGNYFRHCPWPPDLSFLGVQKTGDRYMSSLLELELIRNLLQHLINLYNRFIGGALDTAELNP